MTVLIRGGAIWLSFTNFLADPFMLCFQRNTCISPQSTSRSGIFNAGDYCISIVLLTMLLLHELPIAVYYNDVAWREGAISKGLSRLILSYQENYP